MDTPFLHGARTVIFIKQRFGFDKEKVIFYSQTPLKQTPFGFSSTL